MLGIIGAMDEEIKHYKSNIKIISTKEIAGITYYSGKLLNKDIVLLKSGIGKVNAAVATQILIDHFDIDSIIFTGLAGSLVPYVNQGDVVIANYVVQHDMDLTAFGRRHGDIPDIGRMVETDHEITRKISTMFDHVCLNMECPNLIVGTIASGDSFISDKKKIQWLQREFGAIAAEMEGASVGQVCVMNKIPFALMRIISDSSNENAVQDFDTILQTAPDISFKIIKQYIETYLNDKQ